MEINDYIRLMRVHHYIKNFLVFAALVCSGQFFRPEKLAAALAGFSAFCLTSSVVYIINDIRDKEKDRLHPTKCRRPIASGRVSEKSAWVLAAALLLLAALCNGLVFYPVSSVLLALYLALNLAYSLGMKDRPLVDVAILSFGFLLRMIYGALVTEIAISNWLYLTIIALAFYFSLWASAGTSSSAYPLETAPGRYCSIIPRTFWTKICICAWPWPTLSMRSGAWTVVPSPITAASAWSLPSPSSF